MKIVYETDTGVVVLTPFEGERLCWGLVLEDGKKIVCDTPTQVDRPLRRWPIEGAVAYWAETEAELAQRVALKDVPKSAKRIKIVESINLDRSRRSEWVFCDERGAKIP